MINYEVGATNAALLIQKYDIFNQKDFNMFEAIEDVLNDSVYKYLLEEHILSLKEKSIFNLITKDLTNILKIEKWSELQIEQKIKQLTSYKEEYLQKYKNQVLSDLLKQGVMNDDTLAMLVLGDAYQKGEIVEQNYTEALNIYQKIITHPGLVNRFILSQAYYYQAEIYHYGLDRDINLTKAIILYNKSLEYSKENFYLVYFKMKLSEYKKLYVKTFGKNITADISIEEIIKARLKKFEDEHFMKVLLLSVCFVTFLVMMMRKRLQNYMELYLKDINI